MNYYCYEIKAETHQIEILSALLGELPFDSFEETDTGLNAYIPENAFSDTVPSVIAEYAEQFDFQYIMKIIPSQNWNIVWESNFHPIQVGNFVAIRAEFHPPMQGIEHEIIIHPNMAFGTGHHETTYMMIEAMQGIDFRNKNVFDYGCGTGILAILASKLMATHVEAVDIQFESYEATVRNSETNQLNNIHAVHGELETITSRHFDVILANINRNVILDNLFTLCQRLEPDGKLLISGFMLQDEAILCEHIARYNLSILKTLRRGYWLCMILQKGIP